MKIARVALMALAASIAGVAAQMPGGFGGPVGVGIGGPGGIGGPMIGGGIGGPVGFGGPESGLLLGQAAAMYGQTVGSNPYSSLLTNSPVGGTVQQTLASMGLGQISPFVNSGLGIAGVGMGTIGQTLAQQQQLQYGQQPLTTGAATTGTQQSLAAQQLAEKQQIYLNSLQQNGIAAAFGPVGNQAQAAYTYAPQTFGGAPGAGAGAGASPFFIQAADATGNLAFTQTAAPIAKPLVQDVAAATNTPQPMAWLPDISQIQNLNIPPVTHQRVAPLLSNSPPIGSQEWIQQNLTPSIASSAINWNQQQVAQAQALAAQQQAQLQAIANAQMATTMPVQQQQAAPIQQQQAQQQLPMMHQQVPVQQPVMQQQLPVQQQMPIQQQAIAQQQMPVQMQHPVLQQQMQQMPQQPMQQSNLPLGLAPATVQRIPYTPLSNQQLQNLLQTQLSQLNAIGAQAQAQQQALIAQNTAAQQMALDQLARQQLAPPQVQPFNPLAGQQQGQQQVQQGQAGAQPQFPAQPVGLGAPAAGVNSFAAQAMPIGSGGLPFGSPAFGASRGLPSGRTQPALLQTRDAQLAAGPAAASSTPARVAGAPIPPSDVSVPRAGEKPTL